MTTPFRYYLLLIFLLILKKRHPLDQPKGLWRFLALTEREGRRFNFYEFLALFV